MYPRIHPGTGRREERAVRTFQGKKALFAVLLLAVIILSNVWCTGEICGDFFSLGQQECSSQGQELSCGGTLNLQAASTGSLRAVPEQLMADSEVCTARGTNRLSIISLWAILFKIAVIPSIIFSVDITTGKNTSAALCRTMQFLHDSDGMKGII